MKAGSRIPAELLDRPVAGLNLIPGTLRDQLGGGITLLVFLRHFGCIFCRETLGDLRESVARDPEFPAPLVVFQGSPTEGRAFLRQIWPELRAISDPDGELYEAFGVERGGLVKMFHPGVFAARSRAAARGYENGPRSGDIWRMPGAFLVRADRVLWAHEFRHAADHPDYGAIGAIAASARANP